MGTIQEQLDFSSKSFIPQGFQPLKGERLKALATGNNDFSGRSFAVFFTNFAWLVKLGAFQAILTATHFCSGGDKATSHDFG